MISKRWLALALFFSIGLWAKEGDPAKHPDTKGWPDLFAADLSNADFKPGGWVVEDGVLTAKDHETLWTKKSYGNFLLYLEFKVAKGSPSGVSPRTRDP